MEMNEPMGLLENQVVFITGGARGQGRVHAITSAREGADVAILDICDEGSREYRDLAGEVESLNRRIVAIKADVTSQVALDAASRRVVEVFGKIDAVIVNAGIFRAGPFWLMDEADWDAILSINLTGAWKTAKAVAPYMIERGSGSIVFISSVDGIDPEVDATAYGVSKTGLLGLMKYAALELAPHGIRCNAVAPGLINTSMVNNQTFYDLHAGGPDKGTEQHLVDFGHHYTAMRGVSMIDPVEIANTVVYLNSYLARYVTGVTIPVDAGHLLLSRFNRHPAR
jgi:NAD(P)-dependent dehydrogenase (short-subunit alcohol dehydrogenase family)